MSDTSTDMSSTKKQKQDASPVADTKKMGRLAKVLGMAKSNLRLIGVGLLSILTPILVASEASFKSTVNDWFNTCMVIVDQQMPGEGKDDFFVRLYVQGDTPKDATLLISASESVLETLTFYNDYDSPNRAMKPVPEETEKKKLGAPDTNLKASLAPFNSTYRYAYWVTMSQGAGKKLETGKVRVAAFVSFPETETGLCRVEEATVFNMIVGSSDWGRFIFLALFIILVSVSVGLLTHKGE